MFSCEFREIVKNTFFIEHLWLLLLYLGPYKHLSGSSFAKIGNGKSRKLFL